VQITGVSDPDGDAVTIRVTGVTQDEPLIGEASSRDDDVNGDRDANTVVASASKEGLIPLAKGHRDREHHDERKCPDAVISPDGGVAARAERSGEGNGRVYVISFTATDVHGSTSDGNVTVCVPLHEGSRDSEHRAVMDGCIDDGQNYNSLSPCPPQEADRDAATTAEPASLSTQPGRGPSRIIDYTLPEASEVRIGLYDLAGRRVAELYSGVQEKGTHQLTWSADHLQRGIYFCRLEAGRVVLSKAVLVLD